MSLQFGEIAWLRDAAIAGAMRERLIRDGLRFVAQSLIGPHRHELGLRRLAARLTGAARQLLGADVAIAGMQFG